MIRLPEVRLVGEEGEQIGVVPTPQALEMAQQRGLDLVEVAPTVRPPVCRIMDYSKYKYEQEKKQRLARKKQKVIHIKELSFSPKIEEHDYRVKLSSFERFVKRGDTVRAKLFFKGRERAHVDLGKQVLDRLAADTAAIAEVSESPKLEGKTMTMVFKPKQ
mgnify:CR=1 FL=1